MRQERDELLHLIGRDERRRSRRRSFSQMTSRHQSCGYGIEFSLQMTHPAAPSTACCFEDSQRRPRPIRSSSASSSQTFRNLSKTSARRHRFSCFRSGSRHARRSNLLHGAAKPGRDGRRQGGTAASREKREPVRTETEDSSRTWTDRVLQQRRWRPVRDQKEKRGALPTDLELLILARFPAFASRKPQKPNTSPPAAALA